jgi:hypothetical protein
MVCVLSRLIRRVQSIKTISGPLLDLIGRMVVLSQVMRWCIRSRCWAREQAGERTWSWCVRSQRTASGRTLTHAGRLSRPLKIGRPWFKHETCGCGSLTRRWGAARPTVLTNTSGRPEKCAVRSPTALFMGALYLSSLASSSSTSWPFALT